MALWSVDHAASVDHVQVPKDSTNQPARECDVTMFLHGSRSKESTDPIPNPPPKTLGSSRTHAPSWALGVGDPIPLPMPVGLEGLQPELPSDEARRPVHLVGHLVKVQELALRVGHVALG